MHGEGVVDDVIDSECVHERNNERDSDLVEEDILSEYAIVFGGVLLSLDGS